MGPTSWGGSISKWSNLAPDGSRSVTLTKDYNATDGTLTVKHLIINSNKHILVDCRKSIVMMLFFFIDNFKVRLMICV